jgi:hypothetical protein
MSTKQSGSLASGRQNGSAKSLALFGKPKDSGSSINKAKREEEAAKRDADNAAMRAALAKTKAQQKKDRSVALQELAKKNAAASKRPGFFYPRSD